MNAYFREPETEDEVTFLTHSGNVVKYEGR